MPRRNDRNDRPRRWAGVCTDCGHSARTLDHEGRCPSCIRWEERQRARRLGEILKG